MSIRIKICLSEKLGAKSLAFYNDLGRKPAPHDSHKLADMKTRLKGLDE